MSDSEEKIYKLQVVKPSPKKKEPTATQITIAAIACALLIYAIGDSKQTAAQNSQQPQNRYPRPSKTYCPPTVRKNSSANQIKTLQVALNASGAVLHIDGSFGPKTRAALRHFQSSQKLPNRDVASTAEWHALGQC